MSVGFSQNHREDDDGEEAKVEGEEIKGWQKGCPSAEKEKIGRKEGRG
jgi:hypothetical protein